MNAAIAAGDVDMVVAIDLPARNHCSPGDCEDIPSGLPGGVSVLFLSGERDPLSPPAAEQLFVGPDAAFLTEPGLHGTEVRQ